MNKLNKFISLLTVFGSVLFCGMMLKLFLGSNGLIGAFVGMLLLIWIKYLAEITEKEKKENGENN